MRLILGCAITWLILSLSTLCSAGQVSSWSSLQGPDFSKASISSIDSIRGYLYAGTTDGCIYRSSPAPLAWVQVFSAPFSYQRQVYSFSECGSEMIAGLGIPFCVVIPECWGQPVICYFGPPQDCGYARKLICSSDSGKTWKFDTLSDCWAYTVDHDTVFALDGSNFYRRTANSGAWTSISSLGSSPEYPGGFCSAGVLVRYSSEFVLATANCIARSADNGKTWNQVLNYGSVAGMVRSGDTLLVAIHPDSLIRSVDKGKTWSIAGKVDMGSYTGYDYGEWPLCLSGGTCYMQTDSGTVASDDMGSTFRKIDFPSLLSWTCFRRVGTTLLAGTMWNGILGRAQGTSEWTSSSQGMPPHLFNVLGCRGDTVLASYTAPYNQFDNQYYYYCASGCVSVWADAGWTIPIQPSAEDNNAFLLAAEGLVINGAFMMKGGGLTLLKSIDSGVTWTACGDTLPKDMCGYPELGKLFLTRSGVLVQTGADLRLTADSGTTWKKMPKPSGIPIMTSLGKDLVVAIGDGIIDSLAVESMIQSFDEGASWNPVAIALKWGGTVSSFTSYGTDLYVVTSTGVYTSPDTGKNWTVLGQGLPAKKVAALLPTEKYVFAIIDSGFVYRLDRPVSANGSLVRSTGTMGMKSAATITGNRITLVLGSSQRVRIEEFGIDGRLQKILLDRYLAKGTQSLPVCQGMVSSNIVLLRVSGNGWSTVLKVTMGLQQQR